MTAHGEVGRNNLLLDMVLMLPPEVPEDPRYGGEFSCQLDASWNHLGNKSQ